MEYIVLTICSAATASVADQMRKNPINYAVATSPILLLIFFTLALQYDVGTDYYAYYDLALGAKSPGWIEQKGELLSVALINLVNLTHSPQFIFAAFGAIQAFSLSLIFYKAWTNGLSLFLLVLLYFIFSLTFFNSLNAIRQYTAVYFFIYATLLLVEDKKKSATAFYLCAAGFHSSSLFLLPLIFLRNFFFHFSPRVLIFVLTPLLIVTSILIYTGALDSTINKVIQSVPYYSHYVEKEYSANRIDLINVLTKIPKLSLIIFSLFLLNKYYPSTFSAYRRYLGLSVMTYILLILAVANPVIWRVYQYFDFFSIFPVVILLATTSSVLIRIGIIFSLSLIFVFKVTIFARGEYDYTSILFL